MYIYMCLCEGKGGLSRRIKDREKCDQIKISRKWAKHCKLQF